MSKEFAKYWKELEEPPIKPKAKPPISEKRQVIELFSSSDVKYVELKSEFVKANYKDSIACARALGRIRKSLGLENKIEVFAKEGKVFLVKK